MRFDTGSDPITKYGPIRLLAPAADTHTLEVPDPGMVPGWGCRWNEPLPEFAQILCDNACF